VWSSIHRLKQLEEENAKLKRLVADLSLDKTMQVLRPAVRREMVCHLHGL
jgi:putative transposase